MAAFRIFTPLAGRWQVRQNYAYGNGRAGAGQDSRLPRTRRQLRRRSACVGQRILLASAIIYCEARCDVAMKPDSLHGEKKLTASLKRVEPFDIFPWISDFETGIAVMDEQHKTLVLLLNMLARNLVAQSGLLSFDEIFRELNRYATYHFEAEESLMRQCLAGDVLESSHRQAHRKFTREIDRLRRQSETGPANKGIERIVAFLSRWLANHILSDDRRMAGVVRAIQSGMSIEAAKAQTDLDMTGAVRALIDAVLGVYEKLSSRSLQLMAEIVGRQESGRQSASLQQVEWEHIRHTLLKHDGNISAAARALNMNRRTLQRKLRKFDTPPE